MIDDLTTIDFSGCDSEELGRALYSHSQDGGLYDEVGHQVYGWHGLVVYKKAAYVVHLSTVGKFTYKHYSSNHAAKKAWDHICIKFLFGYFLQCLNPEFKCLI
jgi:hypothetical protein